MRSIAMLRAVPQLSLQTQLLEPSRRNNSWSSRELATSDSFCRLYVVRLQIKMRITGKGIAAAANRLSARIKSGSRVS